MIPGHTSAISHRLFGLAAAGLVLALCFAGPGAAATPDSLLGEPPGDYTILSGASDVTVPFEIYRGDIRMPAEIGGKPVHLMLDNGYMWDQILIFGGPRIDSLNFHYEGEAEVGGPGAGDPVQSRTASGIAVRFPGIEFTGQSAIVTPESLGFGRMWAGSEGQVCATFFKHFVVSIDFDRGLLTLTEPEAFEYKGGGVEVPLRHLERGAWGIPGTVEMLDGTRVSLDLMLDLGYNEQIQIVTGGHYAFPLPEDVIEVSLGFGVQGEVFGHFGRLRRIQIGPYSIETPLAGFVQAPDSLTVYDEAMIGLGLLSEFNIVFDYPGRRMFLEPGLSYSRPFEYNMSGMWLRPSEDGCWEISRVLKGAPAEEAGLQAGDRITLINGKPAASYGFWDLHPMMRQVGKTIELTIVRKDEEIKASVVLRRVI